MAGIIFYFENNDIDVFSGRHVDLTAWNYSCKTSCIDKAIIINKTNIDVSTFDYNMDIQIVSDMPNIIDGIKTQIVCPWETTPTQSISLWDFDHNTDWYLFGPANGWTGNYFSDKYINIPQNGIASSHAVHIASTIMFHRYYTIK